MQMILYYCLNLPKVYKKNLIYLIHTVKTGVSLSTQVKPKFLFSIRQADLLNIVLGMEMKILNVYQIVNIYEFGLVHLVPTPMLKMNYIKNL
jgi:hypothetical protein